MKKIRFIVLFFAIIITVGAGTVFAKTSVTEKPDFKVYIDGKLGIYSLNPIVSEGKTYLPLNDFLINMGVQNDDSQIIWNSSEKSVAIKKDGINIYLQVGCKLAKVNDIPTTLDTAPVIYKSKVFIPVTFIAKSFGKNVTWDGRTNSIIIGERPDSKVKQVIVSSAEEFVKEIEADKRILLKPGKYDLSSIKQNDSKDNKVTWKEVEDGKELNISDISNLTIEGPGTEIAEILIKPRYAEIIHFSNCSNIVIKNIKAGHTPDVYMCDAGVLDFEKCNDITIDSSELYGCGSIGLQATNTKRLDCINTKINHCSLRAIELNNCESTKFSGCKISDHEAYSNIVYINNSKDTTFEQCELSNNNYFEWGFFEVLGESNLLIDKCKIENNKQPGDDTWEDSAYFFKTKDYLSKSESKIIVRNTDLSNNKCDYLYDNVDSITFENCIKSGNTWKE